MLIGDSGSLTIVEGALSLIQDARCHMEESGLGTGPMVVQDRRLLGVNVNVREGYSVETLVVVLWNVSKDLVDASISSQLPVFERNLHLVEDLFLSGDVP